MLSLENPVKDSRLMLKFASIFVPGFEVRGLWSAFWGGAILSLLNNAVRQVLKRSGE